VFEIPSGGLIFRVWDLDIECRVHRLGFMVLVYGLPSRVYVLQFMAVDIHLHLRRRQYYGCCSTQHPKPYTLNSKP
jgi:hypothetical protein